MDKLYPVALHPRMGADPEAFIVTPRDAVRPAKKIVGKKAIGNVIWDNVAVEFQPTPASCSMYLVDNLGECIHRFRQRLHAAPVRKDYKLDLRPAMKVSKDALKYDGYIFGCNPSFTFSEFGEIIPSAPKVDPKETQWRSVGFHIHCSLSGISRGYYQPATGPSAPVSADKPLSMERIRESEEYQAAAVGLFDLFVGTVGVLFENRFGWRDEAIMRRSTIGYGTAGEYRMPVWGIEFRSLSSWPLLHPAFAHMVFVMARDVLNMVRHRVQDYILPAIPREQVVEAINNCDAEECERLRLTAYKLFDELIDKKWPDSRGRRSVNPGGSVVPNYTTQRYLDYSLAHLPDWHDYWCDGCVLDNGFSLSDAASPLEGVTYRAKWGQMRSKDPVPYWNRWVFGSHDLGFQSLIKRVVDRELRLKATTATLSNYDTAYKASRPYITEAWQHGM
jgi:hypothetical protein